MLNQNFINNRWVEGLGEEFLSENPATREVIWQGRSVSKEQIDKAVQAASIAFSAWSELTFEKRLIYIERFSEELKKERSEISKTISRETGKPLWESDTEVGAMISKVSISIQAYHERTEEVIKKMTANSEQVITRHRPHGILAVLGPFNFPGHLPNGHIIPALLAGNTIVFKPSELTPLVAVKVLECWEKTKIPSGIINLVQGGATVGEMLASHPDLNGLMLTGSYKVGHELSKLFVERAGKILALEMGGNNPLVVHNVKNIKAAVYQIIQSAYITAGQRCTCARRLIVTKGSEGDSLIEKLINAISTIKVGSYTERPEPFMGPLISNNAASKVISAYQSLIRLGAKPLVELKSLDEKLPFLSPGLIEVTELTKRSDEEIFGPLLQLVRVNDFESAILEANKTEYGLAAGLFCDDENLYRRFLQKIRAGCVNWNRAITGASSQAPFGGVGKSGNFRPSAYYAADYCVYPVASMEEEELKLPTLLLPGIQL